VIIANGKNQTSKQTQANKKSKLEVKEILNML